MKKLISLFLSLSLMAAGLCSGAQLGVELLPEKAPGGAMAAHTRSTAALVAMERHSPLYMEGLGFDTVMDYYAEVALSTEFGNAEYGKYVRKWNEPIYYRVFGYPTERDMEVLETFVAEINAIEGFPGMSATTDDYLMNLEIYFYGEEDFVAIMGDDFIGSWGGVSFDFSLDDFGIYWEKIAVRSDIEQSNRDSIIVEEIYNGLGLVMDTTERTDSIIYQYSDLNTEMSDVDELLLRLHYHPLMPSGLTYDGAAQVIEGLYY